MTSSSKKPMAMISRPPVAVSSFSTSGHIRNASFAPRSVSAPCRTRTVRAAKLTPIPRLEAKATDATPSSNDFA